MPSLSSAGIPISERTGELDGLKDHAVGHAGAKADVPALVEHGGASGLEHPEVGRGSGQDCGDVDREQHRRRAGEPHPVAQAESHQQRVAGERLQPPCAQLGDGRDRAETGTAEDLQPVPDSSERGVGLTRHRLDALEALRGPMAEQRREHCDHQQQCEGRHRDGHQSRLMALEDVDRGEHDPGQDHQRDDVEKRLGDQRPQHHGEVLARFAGSPRHHHGAGGLAEPGRQRRGHEDADERPLHGVG